MQNLHIEFTWPVAVAGYEARQIGRPGEPGAVIILVARSDEQRWQHPLVSNPGLFRVFAELPETAEACANFASRFGLLFGSRYAVGRGYEPLGEHVLREGVPFEAFMEVDQDRLSAWLPQIRRFRRLVEQWDRARSTGKGMELDPRDLRPARLLAGLADRAGGLALGVRPDCLLSALDLQFYQAAAGDTDLYACDHCGTWFERGPAGTRRASARFCSEACRIDFNNARRGKGGTS